MRLSDHLRDDFTVRLKKGEATPVALNEAVRSVLRRFPEVDVSELDADIDLLLQRMDTCLKTGVWTDIKWRHAASAARATFTPPRSLQAKWDGLKKLLLRTVDSDHKLSFARASFSAYLEGFDPDSGLTLELARALDRSWPNTLPHIKDLTTRFSLFDVKGLDRRIAEFMAKQDRPYVAMKDLGVPSPHMGGLFQLAYRRFVELRKGAIAKQNENAVRQVLHWLHPNNETTLNQGQAVAIDALLLPWVKATPEKEIQEPIRSELIEAYGDPRLPNNSWNRVSKDSLLVMRRWLTGSSLQQFLKIVSSVEGSHMWEPRRKFWQNMHARELIDEAWVILSPHGVNRARELARKSDDKGFLSHGRVEDAGNEARCYLVLRCGRGIVIEGSHNFSIRFYRPKNENRPVLYRKNYSKNDFDLHYADARVVHNGAWEGKAQLHILKFGKG